LKNDGAVSAKATAATTTRPSRVQPQPFTTIRRLVAQLKARSQVKKPLRCIAEILVGHAKKPGVSSSRTTARCDLRLTQKITTIAAIDHLDRLAHREQLTAAPQRRTHFGPHLPANLAHGAIQYSNPANTVVYPPTTPVRTAKRKSTTRPCPVSISKETTTIRLKDTK
jgi:hypothetical protein